MLDWLFFRLAASLCFCGFENGSFRTSTLAGLVVLLIAAWSPAPRLFLGQAVDFHAINIYSVTAGNFPDYHKNSAFAVLRK